MNQELEGKNYDINGQVNHRRKEQKTMTVNSNSRNQARAMKAFASAGFTDVSMLRNLIDVLAEPSEFAELFGMSKSSLEELLYSEELSTIDGLGKKYVALLHRVGVTTITQLSTCDPFELHEQMGRASKMYSLGRVPNRITIEYWIEQAQAFTANR